MRYNTGIIRDRSGTKERKMIAMKKIISLLLVLTLVLALFVGCGGKTGTDGSALRLALVVAGSFGDRSFYDSSKEGAERLVKDLGVELTTIECNDADHSTQMQNAAEKADIVVCVGWEFYEIEDIAPKYPNVKWIWVDNETSAPVDNVLNIVYRQNEGSFLAGYIAAAMSKSGVIGAVGGEDSDTINDFIVGYEQGAAYYNKDIQVVHNYTNGDYNNPALGKECALALNDKKADVIFQIASASGDGVFEAAKERGFYAIGVDSDQKYIDPEVIICSMRKGVGDSIYQAVSRAQKGQEMWGTTWIVGLADQLVGIAYGDDSMTQQISDELKAEVESLAQQIAGGEIMVKTTRK